MKKLTATLLSIGLMVFGCASKPEDIAAVAYPDEAYAGLSCEEIGLERLRIKDSVLEATGQQRSERRSDQAWGWTGAILFAKPGANAPLATGQEIKFAQVGVCPVRDGGGEYKVEACDENEVVA